MADVRKEVAVQPVLASFVGLVWPGSACRLDMCHEHGEELGM